MQFGGNSMTSGKESGFCITLMHRATHHLLYSNSSPRKAFLSSPNHFCPDLALSDFWLFPTLKMGLKGTRFATMEDIKLIECENLEDSKRSIPILPVLPTMAGSMEQVCVRKGPTLKGIK
jgi:hypothetical protein